MRLTCPVMKLLQIVLPILLFNCYTSGQSVTCFRALEAIEDVVYTFSRQIVDANTADQKCLSQGGQLAVFKDAQRSEYLLRLMTQKYTRGLKRLYIHQLPFGAGSFTFNEHLSLTLNNVTRPRWYLDFFARSLGSWAVKVSFCRSSSSNNVWKVSVEKTCEDPSEPNLKLIFSLYASRQRLSLPSWRTIYVEQSFGIYSSLQTTVNSRKRRDGTFYVPDFNVFVGARFNSSRNMWFWSDGTEANFPTANMASCQQRAFHYGIGWEPTNKNCSGEHGLYVCQVKLTTRAASYPCDPTVTSIKWSGLSQLIEAYSLNAKVLIETSHGQIINANYSTLTTDISNLKSSTSYTAKVTALLDGCAQTNVTSFVQFTTSGNPPASCFSVKAWTKSHTCDPSRTSIRWSGLAQIIKQHSLKAKVLIKVSNNQSVTALYSIRSADILNLQPSTNYSVQLIVFLKGDFSTNVTTQIHFKSLTSSSANCSSESSTAGNIPTGTLAGIISGSAVGFILITTSLVAFAIFCCKKERSKDPPHESVNNVFEPPKSISAISLPHLYEFENERTSYINFASNFRPGVEPTVYEN